MHRISPPAPQSRNEPTHPGQSRLPPPTHRQRTTTDEKSDGSERARKRRGRNCGVSVGQGGQKTARVLIVQNKDPKRAEGFDIMVAAGDGGEPPRLHEVRGDKGVVEGARSGMREGGRANGRDDTGAG